MTNYTEIIPKTNPQKTVGEAGCAITLVANVAYTAGVNNVSPGDIASDSDNFDDDGAGLLWNKKLPDNVSTTGSINSQFTHDMYDEYNNSSTEYYIGIKVKYKGTSSNPSAVPHWVGVNGKYTDENGTQYFIISATSDNDSSLGYNPSKNNRGGLGWKNIEGVGTVVPVERVSGYIVFKVNNDE
jgi:hypothetical protein